MLLFFSDKLFKFGEFHERLSQSDKICCAVTDIKAEVKIDL